MHEIPCIFYSTELACSYILPQTTGVISSPDFDGDGLYQNNVDCTITIMSDKGKGKIQLYITEMDIKSNDNCEQDYLQVIFF